MMRNYHWCVCVCVCARVSVCVSRHPGLPAADAAIGRAEGQAPLRAGTRVAVLLGSKLLNFSYLLSVHFSLFSSFFFFAFFGRLPGWGRVSFHIERRETVGKARFYGSPPQFIATRVAFGLVTKDHPMTSSDLRI